jgi:hypothetical protein
LPVNIFRKLSSWVMSAAIQLVLRAVDDRHRIIAGSAQQLRDHGSDFPRADDNDVFHAAAPVLTNHFRRGGRQLVGSF